MIKMEGRKGKNLEKIFIENILKRPWKNGVNEAMIISNFFLLHHLAWTLWSFHHQFLVCLRWWKELPTLKLIKEGKKVGGEFLRHKETGINTEGKKRWFPSWLKMQYTMLWKFWFVSWKEGPLYNIAVFWFLSWLKKAPFFFLALLLHMEMSLVSIM